MQQGKVSRADCPPGVKRTKPDFLKRALALALALFLLPLAAPAAAESLPLDADGFLSKEYGKSEFVSADEEAGRWVYLSDDLTVTITRHSRQDPALVWFESDIRLRGEEKLLSALSEGKKPGRKAQSPVKLARDSRLVLSVNDDYFGRRLKDGKRPGVIIRDGEILGDRTYRADHPSFPNLEALALFRDGSMKTFLSDAHTAEEYLQMGATDVFSFGPILVRDGQPGPHMDDKDYYHYREPRCALGMIEPGHYLILTVKGRSRDSRGAYLPWLAERMLALGAKEALNLDGGGTTALIFMGQILNKAPNSKTIRSVGSLIGFGRSDAAGGEP